MGKEALVRQLNSPVQLVDAWMRGLAAMPDGKLRELATLIDKMGDD